MKGHGLLYEGRPVWRSVTPTGPRYDATGLGWYMANPVGPGIAVCRCGAISPVLPSNAARKRWHQGHKNEMKGGRVMGDSENFEGHDGRECGEHRTTGGRAWCFDCSEWCYPTIPCKGCEVPQLEAALVEANERADKAEREAASLRSRLGTADVAHRKALDGWAADLERADNAETRLAEATAAIESALDEIASGCHYDAEDILRAFLAGGES